MALTSDCEKHDWSWDPSEDIGCPVCHGMEKEQERIIKLLKADCKDGLGDKIQGCSHEVAIFLIKGETK